MARSMDVARALGVDSLPRREPSEARAQSLVVYAQQRAERASGHLLAALVDEPGLSEAAASLACAVVGDLRDESGAAPDDESIAVLHDVAMLAIAIGRRPALLFEGLVREGHAERIGMSARGQLERADEPLPAFVVALREALSAFAGWEAGCAAFSAAIANALESTLQEQRLGALGPTTAFRDAADGAGADLVAIAAGILLGDRTAMRRPTEVELALRLGCASVGRARDVIAYTNGTGPLQPLELVARRFAVPVPVIRLGTSETARCLRAMLAMDVLDLADVMLSIDAREPMRVLLPRAVAGLVELEPGHEALHGVDDELGREQIMEELRKVARLDGRITTDERALLRGMDTHLHAFRELLARIEEDRVVDFEEFQQLRLTRQHVLDDLLRIALGDDVISDDERGLLVRVLELLPALRPGPR
jgi:hypothetical protein